MNEEFFNEFTVNGNPIVAEPVTFGHLKTLVGVGVGIPTYVDEHRIIDRNDEWICTSYPGLVDAVNEELAPIRREIEQLVATGEAPFDNLETALKTPMSGLFIMASVCGNPHELELWADLDV